MELKVMANAIYLKGPHWACVYTAPSSSSVVAAVSSEREKSLGDCKYLKGGILFLSNPCRNVSQTATLNGLPQKHLRHFFRNCRVGAFRNRAQASVLKQAYQIIPIY